MIYEVVVTGTVFQPKQELFYQIYEAQELLATKLLMGGVNLRSLSASTELITNMDTSTITSITSITIPNSQFKTI